MAGQWVNIIACMAWWTTAWGFFFFFMFRRGIDYTRRFWWTALYFLAVAVITCAIFWNYIIVAVSGFTLMPLVILAAVIAGTSILYACLPQYFIEPTAYFQLYPDREYLRISLRRLVPKSMDILAQQIFVVLIVSFLKDAGLSLFPILSAFMVLFGLVHVPLLVSEWGRWPAWLFGGIAVVFSLVFPPLILYVHYGFVYTYLMHWLFYTVSAVGFWMLNAERRV